MFFNHNTYHILNNEKISLCGAKINIGKVDNPFICEYVKDVCSKSKKGEKCKFININTGIPDNVKCKIKDISGKEYIENSQAYCIEIGENTNIYAETQSGIIYALTTLKHLIRDDNLVESFIFDKPDVEKRGLHFFIPGRKFINDFKKMVDDILVGYKYNAIILEVGGAMEYKRHPKINEEWEKYCNILLKNSGIADKIQHYTYPWSKNAIHPENGGGSYLTQEEIKDLVKYCSERGIEVIPEIPSLSHSDYIVRAYPELNERVEDADPDTYCPSNPKTYEIVYDIIDEIADVFGNPKYISIGHDEVVTIGVCKKCKNKNPEDIFIDDIKILNNYIRKKGAKTLMFGDKFCPLTKEDGTPYIDDKGKLCGGLQGYEKGDLRYVPELYKSYKNLPRDITVMNWYWLFDFDSIFSDRDVWLLNFRGYNYNERKIQSKKNIKGIFASNWGRGDFVNMLRNGIIQALIFNSYICWNENYDCEDKESIIKKILKELNNYYISNILKISSDKKYIIVNHTTDFYIPYRSFVDGDFIDEEEYHIGDYVIKYKDGTSYKEKVIYGKNISNINIDIEDFTPELYETSCMTVANKCGKNTYYEWIYENPFPDKEIENVVFEKLKGQNLNVFIDKIDY